MKKIIIFFSCITLLCGCGKNIKLDLVNNIDKKIESSKNYQIKASLEIFRNEEKFSYDLVSTYKKDNYFKVELINKSNNHKQIILKDSKSVYVITPSLNKMFKFQSDWPYNGSQIYLLQPIISDIRNDKKHTFEKNKNGNIITSKVNYVNEQDFYKQKVYFNKNNELQKIEVLDKFGNIKMCLKVINIDYGVKLEDNYFDINKYYTNISEKKTKDEKETQSSSISEIVYPMYVPAETYLTSQNVIETQTGERVILTFSGESSFTLIQENISDIQSENYVNGEPYLIMDTIGSVTDNTVSWISGEVEYSVISDTMSIDELITVAQSVSVEPVGK